MNQDPSHGTGATGPDEVAAANPLAAGSLDTDGYVSTQRPLRVLLIDDNHAAVESLAVILKIWGYDSRIGNSGQEALRLADEYAPDVILLDIGLPGLSGYDVARLLRAEGRFARLKLVAMTGYGQEEDRNMAREVGFDRHMIKPIPLEELQAFLAQLAAVSAHDQPQVPTGEAGGPRRPGP